MAAPVHPWVSEKFCRVLRTQGRCSNVLQQAVAARGFPECYTQVQAEVVSFKRPVC